MGKKRQVFLIAVDSDEGSSMEEVSTYIRKAVTMYNRLCMSKLHTQAIYFVVPPDFTMREVLSARLNGTDGMFDREEPVREAVKITKELKDILGGLQDGKIQ